MAGDPFYKLHEWQRLRAKVIKRDGYRCVKCWAEVRGKGFAHVDHIRSRRKFPHLALEPDNLQTLCSRCHNSVKQRDERNPNRGCRPDGMPADGSWD